MRIDVAVDGRRTLVEVTYDVGLVAPALLAGGVALLAAATLWRARNVLRRRAPPTRPAR
jgi:hypothetical protein